MIYNAVRLTIGKKVFEGLRVAFDITRATALYGRATVEVYNMSLESYDALNYDAISTIEILTENGYQSIFVGNFRLQQRRNESGSSISTLSLFQSTLIYKEKTSFSLDAGTTGNQVINYFKGLMPSIDFIINAEAQKIIDGLIFKGGYTTSISDVYTLLSDFIIDNVGIDYAPYFDNTQIIIGKTTKSPVKVDINTGMIGTPEFVKRISKEKGQSEFSGKVSVRLPFNASIFDEIFITSQYLRISNTEQFASGEALTQKQYESVMQPGNGAYIIKKITLSGDTHSEKWQANLEFIGKK